MNPETWFRRTFSERLKTWPDAMFKTMMFTVVVVVSGSILPSLRPRNIVLEVAFFFVFVFLLDFAAPGLAHRYPSWKRVYSTLRSAK
jgi:hypothetical protein